GRSGEDYGAGVGKWYAICSILNLVPIVNYIAGLAALVLWIMFWIKIAGFSKQLREDHGDGGGDDYDDEDDRPRGRRRDDDEDDEEERRPPPKKRRRDDDED